MSRLSTAIKAFCIPRAQKIVWGDGRVEKFMACPATACHEGMPGATKENYKHEPDCPLSLLKRLGDTEALHKELAWQAHDLDYEGGGRSSCPICKGRTEYKGSRPAHRRNCPGGVAHRYAPDEWFQRSKACSQ